MTEFIPVNEPLLGGNEETYVRECISTGWISSEGPFVAEFEQHFARCVGRNHGVAVSNGSAALDVAVAALEIGTGDEVILPTFTIISCAAAVVRAGAIPVVVDCDESTWNMDVTQLESKITRRTKAVMVVHTYGLPVDMTPVLELCDQYKLKLIEDAAESIGQTCYGNPCGSFGDISTFSFYPNKHITTGEGGMVVTNDEKLAERCRSLRNLCFQPGKRFVHNELGWNYRMTNMQAAIGLAQLEKLDQHLDRKRKIGDNYNESLRGLANVRLPRKRTEYADNLYWVYGLVLEDSLPFAADHAMKILGNKKIGTRPFFWPLHEQPVFLRMGLFKEERHPVAEFIARKGFYIPSGLAISDSQVERVVAEVQSLLK